MAQFFHGNTRGRLNAVYRLVVSALKADDQAVLASALTFRTPLLLAPGDYFRAAAELVRDNCVDALRLKWFRPKRP